jgi:phage protein U
MKASNIVLILSVILLIVSTSGINSFRSAFTDSFETMAHIAEEVENQVYSQLKMTTKELTLNLSGITFPGPARQGDNLNLTGLHIPGTAKCGDGYLLKDGSCQLADLLLMQDLDAQNLILGSLKLE